MLADDDLVAENMRHDPGGDHVALHLVGAEQRLTVSAEKQHVGRERRSLLVRQPVDEQPLALSDAVLLPTDADDRVRQSRLQP